MFESSKFWERRYSAGINSGFGSYGEYAINKVLVINTLIQLLGIESVVDMGCGDGNISKDIKCLRYTGVDVSPSAIKECRRKCDESKEFILLGGAVGVCDMVISMDVIYHLIEDENFEKYMHDLFNASDKFVLIYSTDHELNESLNAPHVKHRKFSDYILREFPSWELILKPQPRLGDAQYFLYRKGPYVHP